MTWGPCVSAGISGAFATVHVVVTAADVNTGFDVSPLVPDLTFSVE